MPANKVLVIGISGGSGSGKSFISNQIIKEIGNQYCSLVALDNYYLDRDLQPKDDKGISNFDTLDSIDINKIVHDVEKLKRGEEILAKRYNYNNSKKTSLVYSIKSNPVILVEGLFIFSISQLFELFDITIFIEADVEVMLERRLKRDAEERGYDSNDVLYRYKNHVIPSFNKFILPQKSQADHIVTNNSTKLDLSAPLNDIRSKLSFRDI